MPDTWGDIRVNDPCAAERPARSDAPGRGFGGEGIAGLLCLPERQAVARADG